MKILLFLLGFEDRPFPLLLAELGNLSIAKRLDAAGGASHTVGLAGEALPLLPTESLIWHGRVSGRHHCVLPCVVFVNLPIRSIGGASGGCGKPNRDPCSTCMTPVDVLCPLHQWVAGKRKAWIFGSPRWMGFEAVRLQTGKLRRWRGGAAPRMWGPCRSSRQGWHKPQIFQIGGDFSTKASRSPLAFSWARQSAWHIGEKSRVQ